MSDTSSEHGTLHNGVNSSTSATLSASSIAGRDEEPELDAQLTNDDEEDPLSVKQLSLNFEYLMYKINDRVKTLSEQTEDVIKERQEAYETDIDRINADLERIDVLAKEYKQIMSEFIKMQQLGYIVKDFDKRLTEIERKSKDLK